MEILNNEQEKINKDDSFFYERHTDLPLVISVISLSFLELIRF